MFLSIFATVLRVFSNSFLNAAQKSLSKSFSPLNTNFKTYFLLSIFCAPIFLIFYAGISPETILWAFIGGFFGALGNAFLIFALKYGELSILGPINSYKAIIGLIFGIILIKEIPSAGAIFGILLILFGTYFIFETTGENFNFSLLKRKDIQFRFLALIFSAIEAVFIKKVILLSDIMCSFLLWVIFGFVFSFLILKIKHNKAFNAKNLKHELLPFIPLAFLVFVMQFSTNFVFEKIPVAPALSLFQLSNLINVFLGWKLFNEKHLLKKIIGSIIMIIGSIVIIFNSR